MSLADAAKSPVLHAALSSGALGSVLGSPLVRATIRYWWLAAPLGWIAYDAWKDHKRKGDLSVRTMLHELTPAVTLAATLVLLNDCLARAPGTAPAAAPPPAKDAEFTVNPPQAAP